MSPSKHGKIPYRLHIAGIPTQNARSRVETQIKVSLTLEPSNGGYQKLRVPEPFLAGIRWSKYNAYLMSLEKALVTEVRPEHRRQRSAYMAPTSTRIKHSHSLSMDSQLTPPPPPSCVEYQRNFQEDLEYRNRVLWFDATVVCVSDPARLVVVCDSCANREARRLIRKRPSDVADDGEEQLASTRILLVNSSPVLDFIDNTAHLPLRITCYCRHHKERTGFRINIYLRNFRGEVVAAGESNPIYITDDHKSIRRKDDDSPSIATLLAMDTQYFYPNVFPAEEFIRPIILHVVPDKGFLAGGTLVSIIGENLLHANIYFGDRPAEDFSLRTDTNVICRSPPSQYIGPVTISATNVKGPAFLYLEDHEQLMQLALTLVGLNINGNVESPIAVASRIVSQYSSWVQSNDTRIPRVDWLTPDMLLS